MRRFISVILTLIMSISIFVSLGNTASAGLFDDLFIKEESGQMSTGLEGDGTVYWNITWDSRDGLATLRLSGDGYMPNGAVFPKWEEENQSWHQVQYDNNCMIEKLIIDEGVRSIMEGAFAGEFYLESVKLPDSLEFIGDSAFSDTSIVSVTLPEKLESFNGTIFSSDSITNYYVSKNNPYFESVDGVVYSEDLKTLVAYPVGRYAENPTFSFEFPSGVTKIAGYAFMNSMATTYTIPGTVKTIGAQAFGGNAYLRDLVIENGVKEIYDGAFLACDCLKEIHLPSSVTYIGYCSFGYIYDLDYDTLGELLAEDGLDIDEISYFELENWLISNQLTLDQFYIAVINDGAAIYAPENSAGHKYALSNDISYIKSQALMPDVISAKAVETGVQILWRASSDADGYYIYRKNKNGVYGKIATVKGRNVTSYTDKSAVSSYNNTYTVKAYNSAGESAYEKTGVSAYYISTPKLVSAKNTTKGIKVTWKKVPSASSYNIYRKVQGGTVWEHIGEAKGSATSYTDQMAVNGKTYYYTVCACDAKGAGLYNKTGVSTKYVTAPKISKVKNTSKGVYLKWNKISGATGYRVYRKTGKGDYKLIKKLNSKTRTFTDKKAKSGVKYSYIVKAVNNGVLSANNSRKTIEYLKMPTISKAKSTKKGVNIKYKKVSGASGYKIYRKKNGGKSWKLIKTVKGVSKTSYTDKSAKKGVTYRYTVKAYSGSYVSSYDKKGYKIKDKY